MEEKTACAQFTGLMLMPLKTGPGSEWNGEQQNFVVQVWQDVTFLWRHPLTGAGWVHTLPYTATVGVEEM